MVWVKELLLLERGIRCVDKSPVEKPWELGGSPAHGEEEQGLINHRSPRKTSQQQRMFIPVGIQEYL